MNAPAQAQRTQVPRLKDHCSEFAEAAIDYERALSKENNDKAIAAAWERLQLIASVFWQGAEFGREFKDAVEIRSWRGA
jgi:hypothetical protein